jgi:hypothetical protein
MIDVEIWYYATSETRLVRFSRKATLAAVPFTGSYISIEGDNIKVGSVTFEDGGGVIICADNEQDEKYPVRPDSELEDFIDERKENGWMVLSNVKRRKGR